MKTSKTCNKCKERKPIFEFYEKMFAKDGYENRCKECRKERMSEVYTARYNTSAKFRKAECERNAKAYHERRLENKT